MTNVVNCNKEKYDIYIGKVNGTNLHYGNPFTGPNSLDNYELWLRGYVLYINIEPQRRQWILNTIINLKGRRLGSPPQQQHGHILIKLIDELPKEIDMTLNSFRESK